MSESLTRKIVSRIVHDVVRLELLAEDYRAKLAAMEQERDQLEQQADDLFARARGRTPCCHPTCQVCQG